GAHRMQFLGNEQVQLLVVLFERSQAVRVPADEERSPQRVIAGRHLADSRHARMPALAQEDGLQVLFLDRVIGRPCVRQQGGRQFDASRDGYKEVHEQESQQNTADFQDSARAPPPDLLRVVEDWFSFFHVAWPPPGLGWTFRRRSSIRAMKRYSS